MTLSFAPDAIETWPLARLQPYAKNAKTHGADQVARIAASMAEFGWTVPCLVADDGELIVCYVDHLFNECVWSFEGPRWRPYCTGSQSGALVERQLGNP